MATRSPADAVPAHRCVASASIWIAAARPRTLSASVVPVIVGSALAWRAGSFHPLIASVTLVTALLIQIGTNLSNDYYDFMHGADAADRLGPLRITQAGLADPVIVKRAAFAVLAGAAVMGVYLVWVGGWPILAVGIMSLAGAIAYTAGPFPLAYHGLGEPFVFAFFGVIAVNGAFYLQAAKVDPVSIVASLSVGCLVTAILMVNNLRDIPTDKAAGKRTLAVRVGPRAARLGYLAMLGSAFVFLIALQRLAGPSVLIGMIALPWAVRDAYALWRRTGAALNQSLAATSRLHLMFGLLLSLGLVL
ncbi:MAG TPA: 1,4-dihydroxy-2-naphthoate polyprenyltransferase [Candidatus Binataceae bacterium]|nr:1,4-dihydroxy-2-naphthoate polyprenyltransferase [Candidatus Binataceae bacterium]